MKSNRWSLLAALVVCAIPGLVLGQSALLDPPTDPNFRQVSMVLQDSSDCANSNVNPGVVGGAAWVVRGSDGVTHVKIAITAKPNTTYHFFLKCVRLLGDIKTWDEGEGYGTFDFRTNEVGDVYAFDMYPEGAPAGNKYQSVQVKY